ncbi:MBL fold metallo-hydrolase [Ideonella livida]|uniref:MBL fold metallo-hydrolase n=1 Tax=Ideonella livida TaxID=2707176 RepID=A0A7C9PIH2_9BURK|nr:MBL fold metallo-hydrolase [Ideonella livida]NDY91910.1 MBL fold metallo-hydrolase [Ideonella livida]
MALSRRQFVTQSATLAGAFAAGALVPTWAQNTDLGNPTLPAPGFRRHRLGHLEILALNDGAARRPLGEEFVRNAPLNKVRALLALQGLPTDYIDIPFTPFVVVAGGRRILIDSGLGDLGGPTTGKLLAQLQAAGLQAGDIDTVLVSHFHGDHINGLRHKAGTWTFPNAQIWVPAPEYGFWMDDARMEAAPAAMKGGFQNARRVFGGLPAERLQRFEPGTELLPGVRSMAAYGHTPGHTLFEFDGGVRERFLYLADLTNIPSLFARSPDWAVQFDMDAEAARQVRRQVFQKVVSEGHLVGGFHFPFPALGRMVAEGEGYEFKPV